MREKNNINGVSNLFQLEESTVALSPDYTLTLLANYTFNLEGIGRIVPSASIYISDEYRASDEPYAYAHQKSFSSIDLGLMWHEVRERLKMKAYILNATDEKILLRAVRYGGNVAAKEYANPRTFGVQVTYHFGG